MQAEENLKAVAQGKTKSKKKTRILRWVLLFVVVLIVLAFLLLPVFVSSEKGRKTILAKINTSVAGRTDFATLSMSWFKGIKVTDFSFNDDIGQTSVQVKQIATRPHYAPILTGSLSFGETIIDEPRVEINLKAAHPQKAEPARPEPSADKKARPVALPIKKIDLIVNNGSVKVTNQQAQTVELSQINTNLNLRPPGRQTRLDIDMAVVGQAKQAKVSAEAQITPGKKTGWTFQGTTGNLNIEVKDLDLGSLGPIFVLAGLDVQAKGALSANIKTEIKDGRTEGLSGDIKGKDLDITGAELKGDRFKTSRLDIDVKLQSSNGSINIDRFRLDSDWMQADARGVVPTTLGSLTDFLTSTANYNLSGNFDCDLAVALSQMPHTFALKEGMKVTSGQLNGNIEAQSGKIQGQANLVGLAGTVDGKKIALSEPVIARVEITADDKKINFDSVDVSAAFAKINATGTGEQIQYEGRVDLAKLQAELGQFVDIGQYQMAGELISKGQVSIKEDKITAVGSSVVKELRLRSAEGVTASEPAAEITFAFEIDQKNNIVTVDSIKANASFGQVGIKNAVLPLNKKATRPMELVVSADGIDLEKLQPFAVLFASFPKEMQLAGTVESSIHISAKKDTYHITSDATQIQNLKILYPQQQPFEQEKVLLIADAEVNPVDKTFAVKKLQLLTEQIKANFAPVSLTTKNGKSKLQGRIDCEYDWAAVSTVAAPFLPQGLKLQGQRKDTIIFSSEYPTDQTEKMLENLNTVAKAGFTSANYMGLNFGPTDVDIKVQNGLLEIAPFSTTVNNGQINFAGQANFKQKPTLFKTPKPINIVKDVQINDEMSRMLLTYLNPIFVDAVNVTGLSNFNCERLAIPLAGGDKNDIEVSGTASIDRLILQPTGLLGQLLSLLGTTARGQDITIHPTKFVLQNGFLRYDNMQMDIGNNPVNFKDAVIGLDTSCDMTVVLPWTLRGRTARVGQDTEDGRIELRLKAAAGEKPKLDTAKLLEDQLKKQLEERLKEELQKGLEGLFR